MTKMAFVVSLLLVRTLVLPLNRTNRDGASNHMQYANARLCSVLAGVWIFRTPCIVLHTKKTEASAKLSRQKKIYFRYWPCQLLHTDAFSMDRYQVCTSIIFGVTGENSPDDSINLKGTFHWTDCDMSSSFFLHCFFIYIEPSCWHKTIFTLMAAPRRMYTARFLLRHE